MTTLCRTFTGRIEITTSEARDVRTHVQLAETERAPDQNGFVSPNHEIIPALHYVACPAIIDRPGFQWRGPVSRVGSRPKKKKRPASPHYN